jgi:acyl-CoA thioester hydrolase
MEGAHMTGWTETFRGVAHPWLCDAYGHLNSRHHMALFDDAGFHFLHMLSLATGEAADKRLGWADVSIKATLRDEVPLGALVLIRSGLVKLGRTSVTYRHAMHSVDDDRIHSEQEVVTVRFDLEARKAVPLPEGMAEATRHLLIEG